MSLTFTAHVAAIALAGAAAWFSIRRMVVLFPGAPMLVVGMAIAMEGPSSCQEDGQQDTLALDGVYGNKAWWGMAANGASGGREPQALVARVQPHDEWH
jgi:hypothetical protein